MTARHNQGNTRFPHHPRKRDTPDSGRMTIDDRSEFIKDQLCPVAHRKRCRKRHLRPKTLTIG
jgi:hypothetical protein